MTDNYIGLSLGDIEDDDENAGTACPDCGGAVEFMVDAPTDEIAERVFIAYYATKNIPIETLLAVLQEKKHFHTEDGNQCLI